MNMNKLVNFTEENLSKIHVSQFKQFLDKHNIEYKFEWFNKELGNFVLSYKWFVFSAFESNFDNNYGYIFKNYRKTYDANICDLFHILITEIYPHLEQGNLTQFHQLFTAIYNEIMSYEVRDE